LNLFIPDLESNMKYPTNTQPNNAKRIEKSLQKLTAQEEVRFLKEFNFWKIIEFSEQSSQKVRELHRVYEFESFEIAFEFMTRAVNQFILVQNHHPRWENTFKRVQVWLSTFELGYEISNKDMKLAKDLERLWESLESVK
jgi:4a-hydroxytetrahydrobiopterin dehydratase